MKAQTTDGHSTLTATIRHNMRRMSLATIQAKTHGQQKGQLKMLNYICKLIGYRVYGFGYSKEHLTLTRKGALSWAGCYDDGAMIMRRHRVVAVRNKLR
jgi:hypothetical protein